MEKVHVRRTISPAALQLSVAECVEQVLVDHGIEIAATIPGGPLMPLLRALHAKKRVRSVLTRHECSAAMLAEGYWRVSRKPALVAVTAGPGVSNATTGVALAMAEQTPMVVLSAQVATSWYGRGAAQELDTLRLLESVTKASSTLVDPSRTQAVLEHLIAVATTGRGGPVHLSVPSNLWAQACSYHGKRNAGVDESPALSGPLDATSTCSVAALRSRLREARFPCVLAGRGVVLARAERELLELAERFPSLRVACTPRSKGAFPECHPQSLGVFGFAGHDVAEYALLEHSDLVLVLGSRLGEITSLGWDERFRGVALAQVDLDPTELGRNFPIQLGISRDIGVVLRALNAGAPALGLELADKQEPRALEEGGRADCTSSLPPSRVMEALNCVLSGNEHVFVDIGNCMAWAIHHLRRDTPGRWHINLMFGCMGHALPAALGGALAAGEPVVVVVGDAAFAMSGFELHTAVENGLPVVVVVLNDSGHGMVVMGSEWQFGAGQVPDARFRHGIDAKAMAHSVGAASAVVRTEERLIAELRAALSSKKPTLIDVRIDPSEVPPFGSRMDLLKKNFAGSCGGSHE